MYKHAEEQFAEALEELDEEARRSAYAEIGSLGTGLEHLPFCHLKHTSTHEYGTLRLWIKLKNFQNLPEWTEMRYRPLISYRRHRWRRAFSMLSRY